MHGYTREYFVGAPVFIISIKIHIFILFRAILEKNPFQQVGRTIFEYTQLIAVGSSLGLINEHTIPEIASADLNLILTSTALRAINSLFYLARDFS